MLVQMLYKGFLTGVVVSLPIGPMAVLVIQRTANRDFRAGFSSGFGIALADTFWMILAGFGLVYIIDFLQQHETSLQLVGATVLVILGLNIFTSHPLTAMRKYRGKGSNPIQYFFTALGIALSSPAIILAYIAVLAGLKLVFNLDNLPSALLFFGGFYLGASTWWFTLSSIINRFRHKFNLRVLWWFNKISGSLIMLFVLVSAIVVISRGDFKF